MTSAIRYPSRDWPFILKLGSAFHIIVDRELFLTTTSTSEAVILLLSVFYAFNITWNPKLKPTFLFLQDVILEKPDSKSATCVQVKLFQSIINDVQNHPVQEPLRRKHIEPQKRDQGKKKQPKEKEKRQREELDEQQQHKRGKKKRLSDSIKS